MRTAKSHNAQLTGHAEIATNTALAREPETDWKRNVKISAGFLIDKSDRAARCFSCGALQINICGGQRPEPHAKDCFIESLRIAIRNL